MKYCCLHPHPHTYVSCEFGVINKRLKCTRRMMERDLFWGSAAFIANILFLLRSFDPFLRSSVENLWAFYILWLFFCFSMHKLFHTHHYGFIGGLIFINLHHHQFPIHYCVKCLCFMCCRLLFIPQIMILKSQQRLQFKIDCQSFPLSCYINFYASYEACERN